MIFARTKRVLRKLFLKFIILITGINDLYKKILDSSEHVEGRIDSLARFALSNCEYYKKKYPHLKNKKKIIVKDFNVIDRREFKESGKSVLADKYTRNIQKYTLNLGGSTLKNVLKFVFRKDFIFPVRTGGTTGEPLTIYKNRKDTISDVLLIVKGLKSAGYNLGDKVLFFYNSNYDRGESKIYKILSLCGVKVIFFNSLSAETVKRLVKGVNRFKPEFIVTFPSYLVYSAKIIKENNLKLNHFSKAIISSGENLYEYQRKSCEEIFKSEIYNTYGSIEFQTIAIECKYHDGLHVFEDLFKVESERGSHGENALVITRYDSASTPLIRYKIGDLGDLVYEECKCGKSGLKIKKIHGRINEYIISPDGSRIYPFPFIHVLNKCSEINNNSILESKITQISKSEIIIDVITKGKKFNKKIKNYLINNLNKIFPLEMNVNIRFPEKIKRKNKILLVERKV